METLMHGSAAETGGAIPSSTVTGRGASGASRLGRPGHDSGVVLPPPLCLHVRPQQLYVMTWSGVGGDVLASP